METCNGQPKTPELINGKATLSMFLLWTSIKVLLIACDSRSFSFWSPVFHVSPVNNTNEGGYDYPHNDNNIAIITIQHNTKLHTE